MKTSGKDAKDGETKVAILLSVIDEEAVDLYNTFNLSEPDKEDVEKVGNAFEQYCNPKNIVYEPYAINDL